MNSLGLPVSMPNGYLGRPNEEQQSALQTLHRFSNEEIQCFLIYARSVESPPQDQPRTQHDLDVLTYKELDAIRILRRYPDVSAGRIPSDGSQGDGHSTPNRTPNKFLVHLLFITAAVQDKS